MMEGVSLGQATVSLGQATINAIAAAGSADLEALGRALAERESLIGAADPVEQANALSDGETIARLLTELRRNLVAEHNRLEQLRSGFAHSNESPRVNLQA